MNEIKTTFRIRGGYYEERRAHWFNESPSFRTSERGSEALRGGDPE